MNGDVFAAAAHVIYRSDFYLAVEAVCVFLAFMGDGEIHAQCGPRGLRPCRCEQCSSERGEVSYRGYAL